MAKSVSLIILTSSGKRLNQFSFSRLGITALTLFSAGLISTFIFLGYHYWIARIKLSENPILSQTVLMQEENIRHQRAQIQKFAHDINEMKARVEELNTFEDQIRIIANLDKGRKIGSVFGIGGIDLHDLDPEIGLDVKHETLIRNMHLQVNGIESAMEAQHQDFASLIQSLKDQKNFLASTPAIRPAKGWISSSFGYRTSPFTGRKEMHKGLDIANRAGTPIHAPADGVVKYVGKKGLLGQTIIIDHGHGMVTRYGHLKKALIKRGEKIKRGDTIAHMGNTGRSTGPHLHYEVHLNGVPVNPAKYILN